MVDPTHEYNHDTCPACAGHGQVATSDGFAACASCSGRGAWAPPASCCAAHDKGGNKGGCETGHGASDAKPKPRLRSHGALPAANMRELLTRVDLEDEDGNLLDAASAFEGKVVALYFSSATCPACASFTPKLARLATDHARDLVVVYVGGDRTETQAEGPHTRGRGFLRVPWRSVHREVLLQSYRVFAIPQVVVYHPVRQKTVTTWGHTAIRRVLFFCAALAGPRGLYYFPARRSSRTLLLPGFVFSPRMQPSVSIPTHTPRRLTTPPFTIHSRHSPHDSTVLTRPRTPPRPRRFVLWTLPDPQREPGEVRQRVEERRDRLLVAGDAHAELVFRRVRRRAQRRLLAVDRIREVIYFNI